MNDCINCLTELNSLDDDPNGDKNCVCAQCRAEEAHDFDAEPNVRYDRAGRLIDTEEIQKQNAEIQKQNVITSNALPGNVRSAIKLFMQFGNDTKNTAHNGYYAKGGWAYDTLSKFLSLSSPKG